MLICIRDNLRINLMGNNRVAVIHVAIRVSTLIDFDLLNSVG